MTLSWGAGVHIAVVGFEKLMSVKLLQRKQRNLSARSGAADNSVLSRARLALSLIVLAIPLSGCGTGALWDKFMAKDDTFVEEPADKLYN